MLKTAHLIFNTKTATFMVVGTKMEAEFPEYIDVCSVDVEFPVPDNLKGCELQQIKNDFEVWWHYVGSGIAPKIDDDMECHARRVAAIAWAEGSTTPYRQVTNKEVDTALDKVLRAAGSALRHYSMPSSLEKMRAEMLAIMNRNYNFNE